MFLGIIALMNVGNRNAPKLYSEIEKHWSTLKKQGQRVLYKKGQVLFYEGHYLLGLYLLLKGKVNFLKDEQLCESSHRMNLGKRPLIGLDFLLPFSPACCTAVAQEACEVIFIPRSLLLPYEK